jgi:SAM-dependent methyltransferase
MDPVRAQYERFPYPPVPWMALPRRGEGARLAFERGFRLAYGEEQAHDGIRILVAGAGTIEPLVVAQAHPRARELVAVDVSQASLRTLGRRAALRRVARPFSAHPPMRRIAADLRSWEDGKFDYILASNCLHHVEDPAALLERLAGWLAPGGLLRLVTYPCASRIWMREASGLLKSGGLAPARGARRRAFALIAGLPEGHPARVAFESHPENGSDTGVIDAFLHARERPLRPLEWARACARAGLSLAAEDQEAASRSSFLDELAPEARALDPWIKLQILDDLLELCANPVLWLRRGATQTALPEVEPLPAAGYAGGAREELAEMLRRVARFLPVEPLLAALRTQVAPRPGWIVDVTNGAARTY